MFVFEKLILYLFTVRIYSHEHDYKLIVAPDFKQINLNIEY